MLHEGSGARQAGASTVPAGLQTPAAAAGACTRRSQLDHTHAAACELGGIAAGETAARTHADGGRPAGLFFSGARSLRFGSGGSRAPTSWGWYCGGLVKGAGRRLAVTRSLSACSLPARPWRDVEQLERRARPRGLLPQRAGSWAKPGRWAVARGGGARRVLAGGAGEGRGARAAGHCAGRRAGAGVRRDGRERAARCGAGGASRQGGAREGGALRVSRVRGAAAVRAGVQARAAVDGARPLRVEWRDSARPRPSRCCRSR